MVIDYSTYPALRLLERTDTSWMKLREVKGFNLKEENKDAVGSLKIFFKAIKEGLLARDLGGKVRFYSKTFTEALKRATTSGSGKKIFEELFDKDTNYELCESGIFQISEISLILVKVDDGGKKYINACAMHQSDVLGLGVYSLEDDTMHESYTNSIIKEFNNSHPEFKTGLLGHLYAEYLMHRLFEKYAQTEVETCPMRHSIQSSIMREKVKNRYKFDIEIRDCRWFTEICKDEDFNVSGHFRLQPYGPGKKEKRLIYIKSFVKHGYHRKALQPVTD